MKHFVSAIREVQVGVKNPIKKIDPDEREKLAVHEAGHAILAWVLTNKRIATVTILRYGEALGHVMPLEVKERAVRTLNEIWTDLVISIGGRAAEIMVYGEPMASVGGDYPAVMNRIEKLLASGIWGTPVGTPAENSIRVRSLFDSALKQALLTLKTHNGLHWRLVEELIKVDELHHEDVIKVLGDVRPVEHIINPVEPDMVGKKKEKTDESD
jgi:cell division protease FtsH